MYWHGQVSNLHSYDPKGAIKRAEFRSPSGDWVVERFYDSGGVLGDDYVDFVIHPSSSQERIKIATLRLERSGLPAISWEGDRLKLRAPKESVIYRADVRSLEQAKMPELVLEEF